MVGVTGNSYIISRGKKRDFVEKRQDSLAKSTDIRAPQRKERHKVVVKSVIYRVSEVLSLRLGCHLLTVTYNVVPLDKSFNFLDPKFSYFLNMNNNYWCFPYSC